LSLRLLIHLNNNAPVEVPWDLFSPEEVSFWNAFLQTYNEFMERAIENE
jgi:hypothetical protein